jgi:hypothetical protein
MKIIFSIIIFSLAITYSKAQKVVNVLSNTESSPGFVVLRNSFGYAFKYKISTDSLHWKRHNLNGYGAQKIQCTSKLYLVVIKIKPFEVARVLESNNCYELDDPQSPAPNIPLLINLCISPHKGH